MVMTHQRVPFSKSSRDREDRNELTGFQLSRDMLPSKNSISVPDGTLPFTARTPAVRAPVPKIYVFSLSGSKSAGMSMSSKSM